MVKRLKPILSSIISPEQIGFVEGRQILDGLVVSQEVIHTLKQKKEPGMMIKLDLSKAYDRLNWNYLDSILQAFGFFKRWVKWIHSMISTPNFSILLNGTPTSVFNATRGLRQGDPLSPFLFIIVAEGLGRYFKKELRERKIKGLRPWGNNLPVTHEQFVDDIMLLCTVSLREVKRVKGILELFMEASGTEINKDKSSTFIFNAPETVKAHLTRTLGFRVGELPTKYLGTLLAANPLWLANWQPTIEKFKNRLANWSFRSLNIAARLVLLNFILQSIPIYPLSVMAVPKGVCTKMIEIFRKFLWGGPKQQKKWALLSWNSLTKAKEGARIYGKIWTQKYNMPTTAEEILRREEVPKGSMIWDLASQNKDIINKHAFWEIRNGKIAKFWEEAWQQRGRMVEIQDMLKTYREAKAKGLNVVSDY
eukprot:PITA_23557